MLSHRGESLIQAAEDDLLAVLEFELGLNEDQARRLARAHIAVTRALMSASFAGEFNDPRLSRME